MIILLGYLQILVGAVNLLGAIIRLIIPYNRNETYKRNLLRYLMIVMIYGALFYISGYFFEDIISEALALAYIFIVPWGIAVYYWTIIFSPKTIPHAEES